MPFIIDALKVAGFLAGVLALYVGKLGFETQRIVIYRDLPLAPRVFENDATGARIYEQQVRDRLKPWRFNLWGWSQLTRIRVERDRDTHFKWV